MLDLCAYRMGRPAFVCFRESRERRLCGIRLFYTFESMKPKVIRFEKVGLKTGFVSFILKKLKRIT